MTDCGLMPQLKRSSGHQGQQTISPGGVGMMRAELIDPVLYYEIDQMTTWAADADCPGSVPLAAC